MVTLENLNKLIGFIFVIFSINYCCCTYSSDDKSTQYNVIANLQETIKYLEEQRALLKKELLCVEIENSELKSPDKEIYLENLHTNNFIKQPTSYDESQKDISKLLKNQYELDEFNYRKFSEEIEDVKQNLEKERRIYVQNIEEEKQKLKEENKIENIELKKYYENARSNQKNDHEMEMERLNEAIDQKKVEKDLLKKQLETLKEKTKLKKEEDKKVILEFENQMIKKTEEFEKQYMQQNKELLKQETKISNIKSNMELQKETGDILGQEVKNLEEQVNDLKERLQKLKLEKEITIEF